MNFSEFAIIGGYYDIVDGDTGISNEVGVISLRKNSLLLIKPEIPSLAKPLCRFGGAQLPNGDLLISGGYDEYGPYNDKYLRLKNGSKEWTQVGTMKMKRTEHSTVFVSGSMFSCGGLLDYNVLSHHECFSLNEEVKELKALPIALQKHTATKISQNEIIVCGGRIKDVSQCISYSIIGK